MWAAVVPAACIRTPVPTLTAGAVAAAAVSGCRLALAAGMAQGLQMCRSPYSMLPAAALLAAAAAAVAAAVAPVLVAAAPGCAQGRVV